MALGSLLTFGQAGVASGHGERGDDDYRARHGYSIRTTTELTVYYRFACAEVSSHRRTPYGDVKFRLTGKEYDTETVRLRRGKACVGLSGLRPGWYRLTARFEGNRRFRSSEDSETFKVRGRGYYKHNRDRYDDHKRFDDCKRYYDDHHYSRYSDDYKRYDDHYSRYGDDHYSRYFDDCKRYFDKKDDDRKRFYDKRDDFKRDDFKRDDFKRDDFNKDDFNKDDFNKDDFNKDDWSKDGHTSNRDWESSRSDENNNSWDGNSDSARTGDNSGSVDVNNNAQQSTPVEVPPSVNTADQQGTSDVEGPTCVVPNPNSNDVAETSTSNLCVQ